MAGRTAKPSKTKKPLTIAVTAVESSNIKAVGHDPKSNTLRVEFQSGGVYHYANVAAEKHDRLKAARSVGQYFHQHIRGNEAHPFTKIR